MPKSSPYTITLSAEEAAFLEKMARQYTAPYRDVIRAKIVLLAAQGMRNDRIAAHLDLPTQIVYKWRKRFFEERLNGLKERPRRPRAPDSGSMPG